MRSHPLLLLLIMYVYCIISQSELDVLHYSIGCMYKMFVAMTFTMHAMQNRKLYTLFRYFSSSCLVYFVLQ